MQSKGMLVLVDNKTSKIYNYDVESNGHIMTLTSKDHEFSFMRYVEVSKLELENEMARLNADLDRVRISLEHMNRENK